MVWPSTQTSMLTCHSLVMFTGEPLCDCDWLGFAARAGHVANASRTSTRTTACGCRSTTTGAGYIAESKWAGLPDERVLVVVTVVPIAVGRLGRCRLNALWRATALVASCHAVRDGAVIGAAARDPFRTLGANLGELLASGESGENAPVGALDFRFVVLAGLNGAEVLHLQFVQISTVGAVASDLSGGVFSVGVTRLESRAAGSAEDDEKGRKDRGEADLDVVHDTSIGGHRGGLRFRACRVDLRVLLALIAHGLGSFREIGRFGSG